MVFKGLPRATRNPTFTQVFRTNHVQKLLEIHVHAKFTQSRWMPDWFFTQSRNYFHPIHAFTLWNMSNHAITLSPWGAPLILRSAYLMLYLTLTLSKESWGRRTIVKKMEVLVLVLTRTSLIRQWAGNWN